MTINNIDALLKELMKILTENRLILFDLNKKSTQDTLFWIEKDFDYVLKYLEDYIKNNSKNFFNRYKPKGNVMIILSYNEPFILSIIPILNALCAGNKVVIKPSSKNIDFINKIWVESGIVQKFYLDLDILKNVAHEELKEHIKDKKAVYFFGAHKVAEKILKICADNFVEFFPEIETADCKVVDYKSCSQSHLVKLVDNLFYESFGHAGQSCQRIQGAYIHQDIYHEFTKNLIQRFNDCVTYDMFKQHISVDFMTQFKDKDFSFINNEIAQSFPEKILKQSGSLPYVVFNPDSNSSFINKAYFLPIVWLRTYKNTEELIELLKNRKYALGLNILSDSNMFISKIIHQTNYSRYTINKNHIEIATSEGWGGMYPSGFSGYKSWFEHFSNPYTVI